MKIETIVLSCLSLGFLVGVRATFTNSKHENRNILELTVWTVQIGVLGPYIGALQTLTSREHDCFGGGICSFWFLWTVIPSGNCRSPCWVVVSTEILAFDTYPGMGYNTCPMICPWFRCILIYFSSTRSLQFLESQFFFLIFSTLFQLSF